MAALRMRVHWGLSVSLALHMGALGALSWVLPQIDVRPGLPKLDNDRIELTIVHEPARPAPLRAQPSAHAASPARSPAPHPPPTAATTTVEAAPTQRPKRRAIPEQPKRRSTTATATSKPEATSRSPDSVRIRSATHADPRSDGSALERVLKKIAATRELTQDERREAMLVVLRAWENPDSNQDAQQLVDALLQELKQEHKPAAR